MQLKDKAPKNYSNESLITGIKEKNRVILEHIYKEYFPMVIDYVGKNSGSREEAKDVFHDALTTIFEKVNKEELILKSAFKTYLFAICKNLWLMTLRRRKTASKVEQNISVLTVNSPGIEEDIMSQQRYKLFRKYFELLGSDCKQVLGMFFQGISLKEIGEKMGFTEAYAKKKKFTCQKQLITSIENDVLYQELLMS